MEKEFYQTHELDCVPAGSLKEAMRITTKKSCVERGLPCHTMTKGCVAIAKYFDNWKCESKTLQVCFQLCLYRDPPIQKVKVYRSSGVRLTVQDWLTGSVVHGHHLGAKINVNGVCNDDPDRFSTETDGFVSMWKGRFRHSDCLATREGPVDWLIHTHEYEVTTTEKGTRLSLAATNVGEMTRDDVCEDGVVWIRVEQEPQKGLMAGNTSKVESLSFLDLETGMGVDVAAVAANGSVTVTKLWTCGEYAGRTLCPRRERFPAGLQVQFDEEIDEEVPVRRRVKRGVVDDAKEWLLSPITSLFTTLKMVVINFFSEMTSMISRGGAWLLERLIGWLESYVGALKKRFGLLLSFLFLAGLTYVNPAVIGSKWFWALCAYIVFWLLSGGAMAADIPPAALDERSKTLMALSSLGTGYLINFTQESFDGTWVSFLIVTGGLIFCIKELCLANGYFYLIRFVVFAPAFFFTSTFPLFLYSIFSFMYMWALAEPRVRALWEEKVVRPAVEMGVELRPWCWARTGRHAHRTWRWASSFLAVSGKMPPITDRQVRANIVSGTNHRLLMGSVFHQGEWEHIPTHLRVMLKNLNKIGFNVFGEMCIPATSREFGDLSWLEKAVVVSWERHKKSESGWSGLE